MRACGKCGTPLNDQGPEGLCPKCLLLEGFQDEGIRRFGDYELIQEIARGGMGVVWKARQVSLNRTVAVKLMLAGCFAGEEQVRRFRMEAQAAASLQHPNIVAIHEIGETHGQPFFSMDFVEGRNLAQIVRDRPLAPEHAAAYLVRIAQAVEFAHQHGILHRDLKPSNILIDGFDQPRITDFGLAKRLSGDSDFTSSGEVLGSPNFLPPEQAEGRQRDVGKGSDVYSLGAVLYSLLTGRAPFQAATVADILKQVVTTDPVPPRVLNPGIPKDLETICLKCLAKEISRRYATAQELADDLERFLRGEPICARVPGVVGKSIRWCRRKPGLATSLAGLVVVFLSGFVGVTWQWRRAQAGEEEARRNLYTADINLAGQALAENNRGRTLELLKRHWPRPGEKDRRGWEWRYLWQRCQSAELCTLGDFPSATTGVAFSPDSTMLAAGDVGGNLKIWGLPERNLVSEGHPGDGINSLAFSPDGRQLLFGHFYRRGVDLWDIAKGHVVTTLRPKSSDWPHHMAAFSPRGDRVAIINDDSRFEVWETRGLTNLVSLTGPKACVIGIEWSPDGRWIACGEQRDLIWLRDAATFEKKYDWPCPFGMPLKALAFSPDSEYLAAAGNDHTARVWSTRSGDLVAQLTNHTSWVRAVSFAPDGQRLATGSGDQTIRLWEVGTWRPERVLAGHQDEVHALAFSPDGQWLASGSKDGVIKLWPARPAPEPRTTLTLPPRTNTTPLAMELGTSGRVLAVWWSDGLVQLWDTTSLELRGAVRVETNYPGGTQATQSMGGILSHVSTCAVANDGTALAVGGDDGTIRLFDAAMGALASAPLSASSDAPRHQGQATHETTEGKNSDVQLAPTFRLAGLRWARSILDSPPELPVGEQKAAGAAGRISKLTFSSDGHTLVSSSEDHTVRVWNAETGEQRFVFAGQPRWRFTLVISPDGTRVAAGSEEGGIEWWRLPEGKPGGTLTEPGLMHIRALAFSADGQLLASGSLDNRVRLWDLKRNTLVRTFPRALLSFRSVAFSPDGERILAGAADSGEIKIWNIGDGEELASLRGCRGSVSRLQFLDADTLLSMTENEVRLWNAADLSELQRAQ